MRIYGPSPTRRISRGALLGGALLGAMWGWTAIESHWLAPQAIAGSDTVTDVLPVHLSLSFTRTRKLAYQRWMSKHRDQAVDPSGMSPVEGKFTAGGKTYISLISAHGESSFTVDLAQGDTWNGARKLRLVRKDAALEEGTPVELDVNGHSEGRFVLTEAPTLEKMLRQGKRIGALFHLDSSGKLTVADEASDEGNPVFAERRKEALAKIAAHDPALFSDPSLARARTAVRDLVVYYDPDTGNLLPVAPDERSRNER